MDVVLRSGALTPPWGPPLIMVVLFQLRGPSGAVLPGGRLQLGLQGGSERARVVSDQRGPEPSGQRLQDQVQVLQLQLRCGAVVVCPSPAAAPGVDTLQQHARLIAGHPVTSLT